MHVPSTSRLRISLLFVISLEALVGCGSPPPPKREYADVTGKVSYKGTPLKMGRVMFQPSSGAMVTADIQSDGTYSLKGVIGPNSVMIVSQDPPKEMKADDPKSKEPPKSHVPAIYGTPAAELKFDVKAGTNKADFDLK